jgi:hypothetical protein
MKDEIYNNVLPRVGKVIEINSENRALILCEDKESGIETPWLMMVVPWAGNEQGQFFDIAIGEEVVYTLQNTDSGFAWGRPGYVKGETPPGAVGKDVLHQIDKDNKLEITRSSKEFLIALTKLIIQLSGELDIDADTVNIDSSNDGRFYAGGNLNIGSDGTTAIAAPDIEVEAKNTITNEAPTIKLGQTATEVLIKANTFYTDFNVLLTALSNHTHGVAIDPGLQGAISTFFTQQINHYTTKTKAE